MTALSVAAVDLGAESGRVARIAFDGERLRLERTRRFEHLPRMAGGALCWDVPGLWRNVCTAMSEFAQDGAPASVGVDAWGVDYGLFDAQGAPVEPVSSYRDPLRLAAYERAMVRWGPRPFYAATGIQVMPINTVFGLLADLQREPEHIRRTDHLLMMPDVLHARFAGCRVTEYTVASTTGLLDARTGQWSTELTDLTGVPKRILPEVVPAGTELGTVTGPLADAGLGETRVILPPAHDTASAVLAAADRPASTVYISSGTWSLVGVTLREPIVTPRTAELNITNEGGYDGTIRFLRNVMGLWILQECRRQWAREGLRLRYEQIVDAASRVPALQSVIDVDSPRFLTPGDMPGRIRRCCVEHGQRPPQGPGEVARVVVDSLALGYRRAARVIAELTGEPVREVMVVGGGSRNALLQQATADALGVPVVCGPVEATALGNAAVQLAALGEFAGLDQIACGIRASEPQRVFEPRNGAPWAHSAAVLERMIAREPVSV